MNKAYKQGYEHGYKDACEGKGKYPPARTAVVAMVNALNPTWSPDEYLNGYKEGYRIGLRDKERGSCGTATAKTSPTPDGAKSRLRKPGIRYNISNMSTTDSYENQLRILANARNRLLSLRAYLESKRESYKRFIERASSAGFMSNYTSRLWQKYSVFSQKVDNLLKIANRHLDLIDQMEDEITRLRTEAAKD